MVALSSTGRVLGALRTAREVAATAYVLRPGRVLDGLLAAARRGAHVVVRLEGQPYHDASGSIRAINARDVRALQRAGADARLNVRAANGIAGLHAKAILADGVGYFDDCNWPSVGGDTIVRDTTPSHVGMLRDALRGKAPGPTATFAIRKRDALALEARSIANASGAIAIESEAFGASNAVYRAIDSQARSGQPVRLLVDVRELRGDVRERAALRHLAREGVRVRTCNAAEKFALTGSQAWVGSANASAAFQHPDQIDWGLRTRTGGVIDALQSRFEKRWAAAQPLYASV